MICTTLVDNLYLHATSIFTLLTHLHERCVGTRNEPCVRGNHAPAGLTANRRSVDSIELPRRALTSNCRRPWPRRDRRYRSVDAPTLPPLAMCRVRAVDGRRREQQVVPIPADEGAGRQPLSRVTSQLCFAGQKRR